MKTLRYILCGAASGYLLLAVIAGLLLDRAGVMGLLVIPAGLIGGGLVGYLFANAKRARYERVVHVLPDRTQDSTHATAA
jgi:hypothetical protein